MLKPYYILRDGRVSDSAVFGEAFIFVSCGSEIEYNLKSVENILSRGISYSIDTKNQQLAEIHDRLSIFSKESSRRGFVNHPSEMKLQDFLFSIRVETPYIY